MKNLFKIGIAIFFATFLLISCEKEPNAVSREDLVGKWTCKDELNTSKDSYKVSISLNEAIENQVFLFNFGSLGTSVQAYGIVSNGKVSVPLQDIGSTGFSVNGKGIIINEKKIEWQYTLENGADRQDFVAVYNKDN